MNWLFSWLREEWKYPFQSFEKFNEMHFDSRGHAYIWTACSSLNLKSTFLDWWISLWNVFFSRIIGILPVLERCRWQYQMNTMCCRKNKSCVRNTEIGEDEEEVTPHSGSKICRNNNSSVEVLSIQDHLFCSRCAALSAIFFSFRQRTLSAFSVLNNAYEKELAREVCK